MTSTTQPHAHTGTEHSALSRRDRSFAKRNGLSPARPFSIRTVRIPLRDGVEAGADLYAPLGDSKGVLLSRTPYGRGATFAMSAARAYAAQGYTVLFVSSRGTADSGGKFDPMRTERPDGQDVVAWMREQPWYPGRFATIGGSYLGHVQWAMLTDPPADLVTSIISVGPHDFSRHAWGTGNFNLDFIGWAEQIVIQKHHEGIGAIARLITSGRRLKPVLNSLPLAEGAKRYFGDNAPWVTDRFERSDLSDPFWEPMQHASALDKTTTPVLLLSGWQDIFVRQSFEQYARLHERGIDVALTSGPWTHVELGRGAARIMIGESIAWLDDKLAGVAADPRPEPVHIFVTGPGRGTSGGDWRTLPEWPSPGHALDLHLHSGSRLVDTVAPAGTDSFVYNPADPTPTRGGPLIQGGGYVNDSALATRSDVLAYTGDTLAADLTIMGTVQVTLSHQSEHADADLFVRLSDVDERGRSRNVTEGYLRLPADRGDAPITLDLNPTAHRFGRGHRIRLLIAGGSFTQFARNPGTGANPLTTDTLVPNRHTLRHAGSSIRLPVV